MLNIIEIINLECSIGELILCSNNNVKTTYNISIVCKNFNEIVRNEIRKYNNELYLLSKKINIKIYDNIILNLKKVYYEYIFEENISNYCFETYLFGLIRKEYLKLINFLENNEEII